ncbi:MAG: MGMT family protein [Methylococcaceae bacterium]|jgi:methylated-DNA-[protein]-cysteine S-methyltransferase
MAFVIRWVDDFCGFQQILKIDLPIGNLIVNLYGDVIASADWEADFLLENSTPFIQQHVLHKLVKNYWQKPQHDIEINLLSQGSVFKNKVWHQLMAIPYGQTQTYSSIAKLIGSGG